MDASASSSRLLVGPFEVDPAGNQISFEGQLFRVEPKVMDVLVALAARAGETVPRSVLIDQVWSVTHGGDESLTRAISHLRRIFAAAPNGGVSIVTAPKRGYRLAATVAVNSAKGEDAVAFRPSPSLRGRQLPRPQQITLAVVLLALALGAVFSIRTARSSVDDVTAVITQFTVAGDHEGRFARLASRLEHAISRDLIASGFVVANEEKKRPSGLRVDGALFGADGTATIHIVHGPTATRIWSKKFDLAESEAAVPYVISDVIACGTTSASADETPLAQMDPVLLGHLFRSCGDYRNLGFSSMIEHGKKAHAHSPKSVAAMLQYAIGAAYGSLHALSKEEAASLRSLARRLAADAEKRRPNALAGADLALGVAAIGEMDWLAAEAHFSKVTERAPDFRYANNAKSMLLRRVGRLKESIDVKRRAISADPHSIAQKYELVIMLTEAGFREEVVEVIRSLREINPEAACSAQIQVDFFTGDAKAALAILEGENCELGKLSPEESACAKAFLGARLGAGDAGRARDLCLAAPIFDPVRYLAALGFSEEAMQLALTRETVWNQTPFLFYDETASLRQDPRFMELAARYRLTSYWIESDRWPDFCREPALPYDCRIAALAADNSMQPA